MAQAGVALPRHPPTSLIAPFATSSHLSQNRCIVNKQCKNAHFDDRQCSNGYCICRHCNNGLWNHGRCNDNYVLIIRQFCRRQNFLSICISAKDFTFICKIVPVYDRFKHFSSMKKCVEEILTFSKQKKFQM